MFNYRSNHRTDRTIDEVDYHEEQLSMRSELLNLLDLQKPFQVDFPNGDMLTYFDEEDKINEFYQQYSIHRDRSRTPEQCMDPKNIFQPEKTARSNSLPNINSNYDEHSNYANLGPQNSVINYYPSGGTFYGNVNHSSLHVEQEVPIIDTRHEPELVSNIIDRTEDIRKEFCGKPENYEYMERFGSSVKPTLSYAQIITQAIRQSKNNKLTLSEIYKWIEENYEYYKHANPVWKNSIRHNLSLSKCFRKVSRSPGSKGKGGYWTIDEVFVAAEEYKKSRRYIRDPEDGCSLSIYKQNDGFFNNIEVAQYKNDLKHDGQNVINSFLYKRKL